MSYTPHQQALMVMGQRMPAVEAALEAEREKVRVLREALTMARHDLLGIVPPGSRTIRVMSEALATTAPKGG